MSNIKGHFADKLAGGLKKITIPEWKTDIYYKGAYPFAVESKIIALQQKGQTVEALVESLILNKTVQDAIDRTQIYLDSGADGIMIHSKQKNPNEILKFCEKYHKKGFDKPIVVVPTTYDTIKEKDLIYKEVNFHYLK